MVIVDLLFLFNSFSCCSYIGGVIVESQQCSRSKLNWTNEISIVFIFISELGKKSWALSFVEASSSLWSWLPSLDLDNASATWDLGYHVRYSKQTVHFAVEKRIINGELQQPVLLRWLLWGHTLMCWRSLWRGRVRLLQGLRTVDLGDVFCVGRLSWSRWGVKYPAGSTTRWVLGTPFRVTDWAPDGNSVIITTGI